MTTMPYEIQQQFADNTKQLLDEMATMQDEIAAVQDEKAIEQGSIQQQFFKNTMKLENMLSNKLSAVEADAKVYERQLSCWREKLAKEGSNFVKN